MLEAAGKKISLTPQPAVNKSLAKAIGSRAMKKSCVASSYSNDPDDGVLEGSSDSEDSENEPLAHVVHQPAVNKGTIYSSQVCQEATHVI